MDSDDLTDMAWDVIVQAAQLSDALKVDLGDMSGEYVTEDDWLRGVRGFLREIAETPEEYVELWDLEEEEGVTAIMISVLAVALASQVEKVALAAPAAGRGPTGME